MEKTALSCALLLGLCLAGAPGAAQEANPPAVQQALEKYRSPRPRAADLTVYQLDWTPTLERAKARAAKEGRPILLIVVANSYGNIYTGHC